MRNSLYSPLGRSILKALATCLLLGLTACNKDDKRIETTTETGPFTVEIKHRSGTGKAVYFSFETNRQLKLSKDDAATDRDWDIAFIELSARTNGGSSGIGQACVIRTDTKDFDHLTSAEPYIEQANLWEMDREMTIYSIDENSLASPFTTSVNPLLTDGKWYAYEYDTQDIDEVIPDHNVYILRTAKGRYVKLQLLDLVGKDGEAGNLQFRYDFISETGANQLEMPAPRKYEKIISEDGPLDELIPENEVKRLVYLTIRNRSLDQDALNYIKWKMPALKELDIRYTTLSISDSDFGFKCFENIRRLVLPINLQVVGIEQLAYTHLEEIVFPGNKLTRIASGAFSFSGNLKGLKLPDSVEVIEKDAFYGMKSLEYLEFPELVSIIPICCCCLCPKLKSVVFNGRVQYLGDYAFHFCDSLTSMKFVCSTPPSYSMGTWPFIERRLWNNANKKPRFFIYVPEGCVDDYLSAWRLSKKYADYFKEF